ncbi:hypothetical protein [Maridesulfovibrio frigidus]|uniref:hypothetical protein n=1 Tax=Maridesulfovibrio frigidus TaxID=340956 RepID=UPI0004E1D56A|nr:hypothetical protein [Maridesulfovibrio frigidus]
MPNIKKLKGSRLIILICVFILSAVIGGTATFIFYGGKMQTDTKVHPELVLFNASKSNKTGFNTNNTRVLIPISNATLWTTLSIGNSTNSTDSISMSVFEPPSNGTTETPIQQVETKTDLSTGNLTSNSTENLTNKPIKESNKTELSETNITPLSYFTSLRSDLELLKLQVSIAEQNQKLIKLHTPDPAVIKAIQQKPAKKKQYRPVWPKIVSIQGVDGRLSATLSSSAGVQTVKPGSNAGPGKVASITPSTVLIRFNGKNVPLKFKE